MLACRTREKGEEANKRIKQETGKEAAHIIPLDLSDLASVREFVREFQEKNIPLHVLLNNAGL